MKIGYVDVTFVHGDILDHLDWLESINASLVLRRELLTKCLERNPYLIKNSVNLQPRWDIGPISNLKWSGKGATEDLILKLSALSNTATLATTAYGKGTLSELRKSLENNAGNLVNHIVLFHKDLDYYDL